MLRSKTGRGLNRVSAVRRRVRVSSIRPPPIDYLLFRLSGEFDHDQHVSESIFVRTVVSSVSVSTSPLHRSTRHRPLIVDRSPCRDFRVYWNGFGANPASRNITLERQTPLSSVTRFATLTMDVYTHNSDRRLWIVNPWGLPLFLTYVRRATLRNLHWYPVGGGRIWKYMYVRTRYIHIYDPLSPEKFSNSSIGFISSPPAGRPNAYCIICDINNHIVAAHRETEYITRVTRTR